MQPPKSMTGIHHDLATNRAEKANANKKFVVVSLTWQGAPHAVTGEDLTYNGTATLADAEARKAAMEKLNPRRRYTILPITH